MGMEIKMTRKWLPEPGTPVTVRNAYGGTATPYTVDRIEKGRVVIRRCRLIFHGDRYFDTLPDAIEPDPNGMEERLTWSSSRGWILGKGRYASRADFGTLDYQPYLD